MKRIVDVGGAAGRRKVLTPRTAVPSLACEGLWLGRARVIVGNGLHTGERRLPVTASFGVLPRARARG